MRRNEFRTRYSAKTLWCSALWNRKCDMLRKQLGRQYFDGVCSLRIRGVAWLLIVQFVVIIVLWSNVVHVWMLSRMQFTVHEKAVDFVLRSAES